MVAPELPEDSEQIIAGEFNARIDGYLSRSIKGEAIFETLYGLDGEPYFFLVLQHILNDDGDNRQYHVFQIVTSEALKPGKYDVVEPGQEYNEYDLHITYSDSEFSGGIFSSSSGNLNISSSSNTEIIGAFNFSAYAFVESRPGESQRVEIEVEGELYALEGDVGIILN